MLSVARSADRTWSQLSLRAPALSNEINSNLQDFGLLLGCDWRFKRSCTVRHEANRLPADNAAAAAACIISVSVVDAAAATAAGHAIADIMMNVGSFSSNYILRSMSA